MNSLVALAVLFSIATARNPYPYELVGGLNPDYGTYIPPTPVVKVDEEGQGSVDNYPRTCDAFPSWRRLRCVRKPVLLWPYGGL